MMKHIRVIRKVLWVLGITLVVLGFLGNHFAISQTASTAAPTPAAAMAMTAPAADAITVTAPAATNVNGDPNGGNTGSVNDITAAKAGSPTLTEIATQVGKNKIGINFVWVLLTGYLVMFMQAGFALVETGFTRAKNAAHTMAMNMVIYGLGVAGFYLIGYGLMFGGLGALGTLGGNASLSHEISVTLGGKTMGLIGWSGFCLGGHAYDVGVLALFLFQVVFMDAAATIPTGALAERWKFVPFCIWGLFVSGIMYPIYGNWVWGGGWLSQLGANFGLGHGVVDFAGSSVVHAVGGIASIAGVMVLGARIGKFRKDGTPVAIPGHNLPMALLGVFILAFGWFGFNPGSTLAGVDLRIAVVAVNTMLASCAGMLAAMILIWKRTGKPDPGMTGNGALAGLVAITAPCAFVSPLGAIAIGIVSGILVVYAAWFVEWKLKLDDPVGAIAVHGANGLWGLISVGLFADGTYGAGLNGVASPVRGLFYGDAGQFVVQLIGAAVCFAFVFSMSWTFFKIMEKTVGMRVSPEAELLGIDVPEVGALAYPRDDMLGFPDVRPMKNIAAREKASA